MLRRLEPEQAPALGVPERLAPRVERLRGRELVLAADVAEVAAEPPVAQARAHLGVPRHEPAVELLLVEERRLFAQRCEPRVRVGQELRVCGVEPRQVEATIVIPPRAFCCSATLTRSCGSSSASATSSRIRTASASQNAPSLRNEAR